MKCIFFTNSVSAHQLPLARELVKMYGADEFRYVYTTRSSGINQEVLVDESWVVLYSAGDHDLIESCDVLVVGGLKPIDILEKRARRNLKTFYMSERWFKPPLGMLRLLNPRYLSDAYRLVRLLKRAENFIYLPIGVHAASDMARLCGAFAGDVRCLFRSPKLDFIKTPGGEVRLMDDGDGKVYGLNKMRMWGYFVEDAKNKGRTFGFSESQTLKVLWVGRMLDWKCVDTIIKAVVKCSKLGHGITLDVYGTGPEEKHLKKMIARYNNIISLHSSVPISEVRGLMREHGVYVLSSNGYEGWGAVVGEALAEGMYVLGTYEAGASATLLPDENLFHCGDVGMLAKKLLAIGRSSSMIALNSFTPRIAAEVLEKGC